MLEMNRRLLREGARARGLSSTLRRATGRSSRGAGERSSPSAWTDLPPLWGWRALAMIVGLVAPLALAATLYIAVKVVRAVIGK